MIKTLLSLLLLGAAGGLFFLFTDPQYQTIKATQISVAEYDNALNNSKELQRVRNELIAKRNTFSADDVRKAERLLPDNVDNIRLILDIDGIAARYGLRIRNVNISSPLDTRGARSDLAVGSSDDHVGSVELSFTVSAQYEDFLRLLKDLERSIRIVDVTEIAFTTASQGDLTDYSVRIKTYWLR